MCLQSNFTGSVKVHQCRVCKALKIGLKKQTGKTQNSPLQLILFFLLDVLGKQKISKHLSSLTIGTHTPTLPTPTLNTIKVLILKCVCRKL
jgi:hypothetical protein